MKPILTYTLVFALVACSPSAEDRDNTYEPVLFASIAGGEAVDNVQLLFAGAYPHSNTSSARIFISKNDEPEIELTRTGNEFFDPGQQVVEFGSNYKFRVLLNDGDEMLATAIVPSEIALISASSEVVSVSAPGTVASILSWTSLGGNYAYALKLECLELSPVLIGDGYGQFENRNGLSQLQSQLLLLKDDFKYYGQHRLTVYAFDKSLEELYFFDPSDIRGLLRNAPDNVTGGGGFVTGLSNFVVDIQINE